MYFCPTIKFQQQNFLEKKAIENNVNFNDAVYYNR